MKAEERRQRPKTTFWRLERDSKQCRRAAISNKPRKLKSGDGDQKLPFVVASGNKEETIGDEVKHCYKLQVTATSYSCRSGILAT